nr:hypothetical protein CFP56_17985 [Quercus suber]
MHLDTGYNMGCDATGPLPFMSRDDAGPSHRFTHGDTSQSPSMILDDTCPPTSSTTSPGERIEWVEDRLQRSQQTWTHPPDYGIGDGKVRPIKELVRRRK